MRLITAIVLLALASVGCVGEDFTEEGLFTGGGAGEGPAGAGGAAGDGSGGDAGGPARAAGAGAGGSGAGAGGSSAGGGASGSPGGTGGLGGVAGQGCTWTTENAQFCATSCPSGWMYQGVASSTSCSGGLAVKCSKKECT